MIPFAAFPAAATVFAPLREKVLNLEAHAREMPQIEPPTNHYFADGMYCRELIHPAGVLIVGKVHRKEHFFIVTKGCVDVVMDDWVRTLTEGAVLVSSPGTKRALFSLDGATYMTVHKTDKTDLDEIEAELVESANSLFDASNKLKALK